MRPRASSLYFRVMAALLLSGLLCAAASARGFDLQGHRGARGLMPENTLPAFARALEIGVSTLELDLAMTRDGEVVVMHNPRFEPILTRDRHGAWLEQASPSIHSMDLAQVKTYDVGRLNPASKYARRYPQQQAIDGTPVPTLGEVFDLVRRSGNEKVHFNIEIKINPERPGTTWPPRDFARAVLKVIRDHGMEPRVVVQSFDWSALRAIQEMTPKLRTSYLTVSQDWLNNMQAGMPGASPWLGGLDIDDFNGDVAQAISAAGGVIWSPYHREVSPASIERARKLGLKVMVWTVNEVARMRELIEMGVDGIITDYPDRLRAVLLELEMPVPASTPLSTP